MSNYLNNSSSLMRTPLFDAHVSLKAKMAPFGGYEMPIQYESQITEHEATRTGCTIFDTCHMGEFIFKGRKAVDDLEKILSCSVSTMEIGQCRYGFICNESGGVIDDQIIYRIEPDNFFMVVNASTQSNDFKWIREHISTETLSQNISDETGKVDLQGPGSPKIMQKLMKDSIADMKYYRFRYNTYRNTKILTSRTGYTGEIGFEIYCDTNLIKQFFSDSISLGAKPAGLGARDTLRLEMGLPLYGHELDEKRNPMESGFNRSIDVSKKFIGSDIVCDPERKLESLVGLTLSSRRASRAGDIILDSNSSVIGKVTSGSYSPSLGTAIALGYVKNSFSKTGTKLVIDSGRQKLDAVVTQLPFYKKATARTGIEQFL